LPAPVRSGSGPSAIPAAAAHASIATSTHVGVWNVRTRDHIHNAPAAIPLLDVLELKTGDFGPRRRNDLAYHTQWVRRKES
jgi:hypothetical protein